ncbi:acyl carrier protein [Streptomyces sp. NBC_00988]|uniref:acyl carrier protein n=1 Tax=Streptomyces sp. NBC_00988 TaxID=2903704 RepID=UPI00386D594A|nr:acyl carrier protein [Streptomyces sp. NBC_00988]
MTTPAVAAEEIRDWLITRVAFYLECPAKEIRGDARLAEYGLDSLYALTLCGDIEDEFGIAVSPTLAWDHPSVDAITELLHQEIAAQRASTDQPR